MNRHRTHQIDDLSQRVLRDALPPTWVPNEQQNDYGKDYLVEIGEDNGDLTGTSFFVQLKGQERANRSVDGGQVKYSLETKYAAYYLDKIKDLPVFLVVVDVKEKNGWWLFLQPLLAANQNWRKQDSTTVYLSVEHELSDTPRLRQAVEEAKTWMRLHHPLSIQEAVAAHKDGIKQTDPRFDVDVSLVNGQPAFTLLAKEEVPVTFTISGERDEIEQKVKDLVDKGALVSFQPGQLKVTGPPLFESFERLGGAMQWSLDRPATLSFVARDDHGSEIARISDMPGRLSGGQKELWFEGGLANSPLSVRLGPLAPNEGGSVKINLSLRKWNSQRLLHLAHFNHLSPFFQALPRSAGTDVECYHDGNLLFKVTTLIQTMPFSKPTAEMFGSMNRARQVAERFGVNPLWDYESFQKDDRETGDQLYAVFFGNGWTKPMPRVRIKATLDRKTFRPEVAKKAHKPGAVRFTSDCVYSFFGQKVEVGRLVHDYTDMSITIPKPKALTRPGRGKGRGRTKAPRRRSAPITVRAILIGSKSTVMSVRAATPDDD